MSGQINWPMEMERRNRELAAMTEARDTLAAVVAELKKDRDEWKQAAGVEAGLRREFKALSEKLQGCLNNYQQTFDLQWEADMRAVKRWRAAHPGNDLVLPDRANMVVWLLDATYPTGEVAPEKHEYPSAYPPGVRWSLDAAWEILDTIRPGVLSPDVRAVLAGYFAGRLEREREGRELRERESRVSDEGHAAGRTKAGNDIGGL